MKGLRRATPVIAVVGYDDQAWVGAAILDHEARMDDAYWAYYARQPFTWQRFINWWIARRWVIPRDITKE